MEYNHETSLGLFFIWFGIVYTLSYPSHILFRFCEHNTQFKQSSLQHASWGLRLQLRQLQRVQRLQPLRPS